MRKWLVYCSWRKSLESNLLDCSCSYNVVGVYAMKKYQIIYADPPWSYNDKMRGHMGAITHYETQGVEWICSLPVKNIADKNCVLFMWAVSPQLREALKVIESWGFKYTTVGFCWIKETPLFKQVKNLGRWTMGGCGLCLLAKKGHPKRIKNNVVQTVFDIRTKHSRKPDEVKKRIIDLMGDLPRIELFAREKTPGWDVWGNEVDSNIIL